MYLYVHEVTKKRECSGIGMYPSPPFQHPLLKTQAHVHLSNVHLHAARRSDGDSEDYGDVVAYFPRQLSDFLA
jgi:hypothetical protein